MQDKPSAPKRRPNRNRLSLTITLPYDVWQRVARESNRSATVELALRLYYHLPPEGFERCRDA